MGNNRIGKALFVLVASVALDRYLKRRRDRRSIFPKKVVYRQKATRILGSSGAMTKNEFLTKEANALLFPSLFEATRAWVHMMEAIEKKGEVSLSEYYELIGTEPEDDSLRDVWDQWGWNDLSSAQVRHYGSFYALDLPMTDNLQALKRSVKQ